ncbi:hypothetical protein A4S06_00445 [Erysipelotrichaceae bacterium MTC7]|nr:hypothetical protein A4S06_00445 [Erysipelotrichaceae bacterium MTC7]
MKHIEKAIATLNQQKVKRTTYTLLRTFDFFNYTNKTLDNKNQIVVDPYDFYRTGLQALINDQIVRDGNVPLSKCIQEPHNDGNWIQDATIYSSLIRASSAYDHDQNGQLALANIDGFKETGTFLKQIFILPYLKSLGVNTLYTLPFFKLSSMCKKEELGSCYSISDPFSLDETYLDPMLEGMDILEQAQMFMEAAHLLGIRVIVDIIPRTSSRDSQ